MNYAYTKVGPQASNIDLYSFSVRGWRLLGTFNEESTSYRTFLMAHLKTVSLHESARKSPVNALRQHKQFPSRENL